MESIKENKYYVDDAIAKIVSRLLTNSDIEALSEDMGIHTGAVVSMARGTRKSTKENINKIVDAAIVRGKELVKQLDDYSAVK